MTVTVKFFGALRTASGKGNFAVQVKEAVSVREIMNKIVEELPRLNGRLLSLNLRTQGRMH